MMPSPLRDGHEVDRRGAGHDQRVQDRLVAVAVAQHQVAARNGAVPDDLVRGRSAADHEQGFVRAEDARRVALARGDRPRVVEQRPELPDRHRNVGAQRVLAEELVEQLAYRALAERHAAAVAGRVPGVAGVQRVVHQRLEHRRRQALEVELRRARDGAGEELGRVLEQAHEGVRVPEHARRNHLGRALVAEQEDRQAGRCGCAWRPAPPRGSAIASGVASAPSTETSQHDSVLKTLTSRRASS